MKTPSESKTALIPAISAITELVQAYQLMFELMGKTLYLVPSRNFFDALIKERAFEELPLDLDEKKFQEGKRTLVSWSQEQNGTLSDEAFDRLVIDDTRLFSGEQKMLVPPWESVYFNEERLVFQRETMSVRAWYRKYGLQLVKLHHEPDDHIGLEIDFLAQMLKLSLEYSAYEERVLFLEILNDALAFAKEHPLRWIDRWAKGVEKNSRTQLYRGIAMTLPSTLSSFVSTMQESIEV